MVCPIAVCPPAPPDPHWSAEPAPSASADALVGEVEGFLRAALADVEPERPAGGAGRPRVLPALLLWTGLLVCVLRGFTSQLALWRLLAAEGLWAASPVAVGDQAVYKRLAQGGVAPLVRLFEQVTALLAARLTPLADADLAPFATAVVALDETTLDPLARSLPALRALPSGDAQLLPGRAAGLFDLRRQQWRRVAFREDARQNEKVAAREMVRDLPPGSLVLADLGYFGFHWFDELTDAGHWWISRWRAKTSFVVLHTSYHEGETLDQLIWLGAHRADRAKHAVRLVQFRHGQTLYRYLTNVRDPRLLPLGEIARLYARRWDFELAVKLVKRRLGLHLWWSAKPVVVQQQLWAVFTVAQILHALQLEIAQRAGVDPFEVSLALFVEYAPRFAAQGRDPVAAFVEQGRTLRFIRPSTRTVIHAPTIPPGRIRPAPPGLALVREPRYAQRRCGTRADKGAPG